MRQHREPMTYTEQAAAWQGQDTLYKNVTQEQHNRTWWVHTDRLVSQGNATNMSIWGTGLIRPTRVLECALRNQTNPRVYTGSTTPEIDTHRYHVERIAHLILHRDHTPLEVEMTDIVVGAFEVQDGWHRLTAAQILFQRWIRVTFGGWVETFFATFPEARRTSPLDNLICPADPLTGRFDPPLQA